jgi:hypothetical protein
MKRIDNGRRMEMDREPEWKTKVDRAIAEAPDLVMAEFRDKKMGSVTADFLSGKIDVDEYRASDKAYASEIRGHLRFVDAQAFEEAMKWILMKHFPGYDLNTYIDRARGLREHEEKHYLEAAEYGLKDLYYLVRFFRDEDSVSFRPGIAFDLPEGMSAQELRALLRQIIEAPDELSDLDEEMLS